MATTLLWVEWAALQSGSRWGIEPFSVVQDGDRLETGSCMLILAKGISKDKLNLKKKKKSD